MKLIEKGKDGAEPVHMSWDAAQAALASGAYELAPAEGERDVDQPGAQTPAPGTDPVDGKEKAAEGQTLTNIPAAASSGAAPGLPKSPPPPEPPPAKNPAPPAAAPATAPQAAPAPAPVAAASTAKA